MKRIILFILLFTSIISFSQTQSDSAKFKTSITLAGKRVTKISNDTSSSNNDSLELITKFAAKKLQSSGGSSFDPTSSQSITGDWVFQGNFSVDNGDAAAGFKSDVNNAITSVGDWNNRNYGTVLEVHDNDKAVRVFADALEGWDLNYVDGNSNGWIIPSNGNAVFGNSGKYLGGDGFFKIEDVGDGYKRLILGDIPYDGNNTYINIQDGLSLIYLNANDGYNFYGGLVTFNDLSAKWTNNDGDDVAQVYSDGSAFFAKGNIQIATDGHLDIAEAIDLYPNGAASFAEGKFYIGGTGWIGNDNQGTWNIQETGQFSFDNDNINSDGHGVLNANGGINGSTSFQDGGDNTITSTYHLAQNSMTFSSGDYNGGSVAANIDYAGISWLNNHYDEGISYINPSSFSITTSTGLTTHEQAYADASHTYDANISYSGTSGSSSYNDNESYGTSSGNTSWGINPYSISGSNNYYWENYDEGTSASGNTSYHLGSDGITLTDETGTYFNVNRTGLSCTSFTSPLTMRYDDQGTGENIWLHTDYSQSEYDGIYFEKHNIYGGLVSMSGMAASYFFAYDPADGKGANCAYRGVYGNDDNIEGLLPGTTSYYFGCEYEEGSIKDLAYAKENGNKLFNIDRIGGAQFSSLKLKSYSTSEINSLSPSEGLQVYNSTLHTICFYNGTSWQKVSSTNMN